MKVFVAGATGATGVLGRRAVRRLVEAGHEVTGVARSPEKAEELRALGATPARVDQALSVASLAILAVVPVAVLLGTRPRRRIVPVTASPRYVT